MENSKINIEEGSITFWTKAGNVNWAGNDVAVLFEKSFDGNSIFILKDSDSKLKFFHVYFNKGRTDVEINVKDLNPEERHFIVATWSLVSREISLNVDGNKFISKQKIEY